VGVGVCAWDDQGKARASELYGCGWWKLDRPKVSVDSVACAEEQPGFASVGVGGSSTFPWTLGQQRRNSLG